VIELSHAADSRWKEEKMPVNTAQVNWEIVDMDVHAEFRRLDVEDLAEAFVDAAFADVQDDVRINSIAELGQGKFSVRNNRGERQQLFMIYCNKVIQARKAI
jgi:D-lyxose ketol-isomerase